MALRPVPRAKRLLQQLCPSGDGTRQNPHPASNKMRGVILPLDGIAVRPYGVCGNDKAPALSRIRWEAEPYPESILMRCIAARWCSSVFGVTGYDQPPIFESNSCSNIDGDWTVTNVQPIVAEPFKMADVTMEEIESLQREFDWVLSTEVRTVVEQLRAAVQVPTDKVAPWFHNLGID